MRPWDPNQMLAPNPWQLDSVQTWPKHSVKSGSKLKTWPFTETWPIRWGQVLLLVSSYEFGAKMYCSDGEFTYAMGPIFVYGPSFTKWGLVLYLGPSLGGQPPTPTNNIAQYLQQTTRAEQIRFFLLKERSWSRGRPKVRCNLQSKGVPRISTYHLMGDRRWLGTERVSAKWFYLEVFIRTNGLLVVIWGMAWFIKVWIPASDVLKATFPSMEI